MSSIDLHAHSLYSDGTLSPTELVKRAHENNVKVLALTDHDITDGLEEANRVARELGIKLVAGVEISVTWARQTIHIVGLNIDTENTELQAGLARIREQRVVRARRMAEKLEKAGFLNVFESVTKLAGTEAATRTHFARFLLGHGHVDTMQKAFKLWLGKKGKAFVGGDWVTLEEAVGWICRSGGQAVIAHPVRYNMTRTKMGVLVDEFKQNGGIGIEVSTSSQATHERKQVVDVANRYGLLCSVGSDFHSPGNPRVELGRNLDLPRDANPIWQDWEDTNFDMPLRANGGLR